MTWRRLKYTNCFLSGKQLWFPLIQDRCRDLVPLNRKPPHAHPLLKHKFKKFIKALISKWSRVVETGIAFKNRDFFVV